MQWAKVGARPLERAIALPADLSLHPSAEDRRAHDNTRENVALRISGPKVTLLVQLRLNLAGNVCVNIASLFSNILDILISSRSDIMQPPFPSAA